MTVPNPSRQQQGMVMVIVLWMVVLLAVMAGSFAYSMRVETRLATSAVERAQTRALAEAGVIFAFAWQLDPDARQQEWPPNGDPHNWSFGGRQMQIRVEDAAGRVNLNYVNPSLLRRMLESVGLSEDDQERVAAVIEDWRDRDDDTRPEGAESAEYQAAGHLGPKNQRFESVDELQQLLGVGQDIAQRIAGLVTIHGRASTINPEVAPARVLNAVGDDEQAVASYLEDRTHAAESGEPLPPFSSGEGRSFFSRRRSAVYHISTTVGTGTGAAMNMEAVVSRQSLLPGQAVRFLSWRLAH